MTWDSRTVVVIKLRQSSALAFEEVSAQLNFFEYKGNHSLVGKDIDLVAVGGPFEPLLHCHGGAVLGMLFPNCRE